MANALKKALIGGAVAAGLGVWAVDVYKRQVIPIMWITRGFSHSYPQVILSMAPAPTLHLVIHRFLRMRLHLQSLVVRTRIA